VFCCAEPTGLQHVAGSSTAGGGVRLETRSDRWHQPTKRLGNLPHFRALGGFVQARPRTFAWGADGVGVGVKYLFEDVADRVNN
jgi:hypothetical protein